MASQNSEIEQTSLGEGLWLSGKVVRGLQNGRRFGFPTINIALDKSCSVEDTGVFAVELILRERPYKGMLYIGTRPTLSLQDKTLEINIFNFDGECYDEDVKFRIGPKIRSEQKFVSVEDLINQLKKDKDEILQIFDN